MTLARSLSFQLKTVCWALGAKRKRFEVFLSKSSLSQDEGTNSSRFERKILWCIIDSDKNHALSQL